MGRFTMNGLMLGGAALALFGLIAFAIPAFTMQQTKDVAKIGDLKLQATESTSHIIAPIVSGGALILGAILIGAGPLSEALNAFCRSRCRYASDSCSAPRQYEPVRRA